MSGGDNKGELLASSQSREIQTGNDSGFMSMIAAAISNPDVDVAKMQALMEMKYKEEDRQAEKLFNSAMTKCQEAMPDIAATSFNSHTKSYFAKLEAIVNAITPIYTSYGFSLAFGTAESSIEGWLRTTMTLRHSAGHSVESFYDLPIDNAGANGNVNKSTTHGVASTRSYARRYLQVMAFNLSVGEDNDGNLVTQEEVELITADQQETLKILIVENECRTVDKWLAYWSSRAKFDMTTLADMPVSIYDSCYKNLLKTVETDKARAEANKNG